MGSEKLIGPNRQFITEGDRSRMLQMGTTSHRRCPMDLGVCQKALYGVTHIFGKKSQSGPALKHQPSIDNILGCCSPMHVGTMFTAPFDQLTDQRNKRMSSR